MTLAHMFRNITNMWASENQIFFFFFFENPMFMRARKEPAENICDVYTVVVYEYCR